MTKGDIMTETGLVVIKGKSKTNTAIAKGDVVVLDTDGWAGVTSGTPGPFGVCLDDVAAVAGTQFDIRVAIRGRFEVTKPAGALIQGQPVKGDSTGAVELAVLTGMAPDELMLVVGTVIDDAANADTTVVIELGY